jgi:ADP-ribosylglycohydrolase
LFLGPAISSLFILADERCRAGAVAVATAVSFALRHESFLAKDFLDEIERNCADVSAEFTQSIIKLRDIWLNVTLQDAISEISRIRTIS